MQYEGKLSLLKRFKDKHYAVTELDFKVEGKVLWLPSLPFIMMRLDHPHGKASKDGWRFTVSNVQYIVPCSELQRIIKPYHDEQQGKSIERFFDVWQNKNN